jgi:glycosyltransferase involved in cell wall biosynthesis
VIPDYDYLEEVEGLGIDLFTYRMQRTGINPISDVAAITSLAMMMRKHRPRTVFNYGVKPVVYGAIAARMARIPHVYGMITGLGHAYTTQSLKTRMLRMIVTRLYRLGVSLTDGIFFQNPDDEAEFIQLGVVKDRSKVTRINGSGVNTESFPQKPLPSGDPVFLFIGRLLTEKGIAEFVEAAVALRIKHPNCRFVAVGPHDANLPHAVSGKTLAEWRTGGVVEFIGGVKDVRPWLQQCTVFVLPSYREGTPRSVLEAMSTGRPIITSNAPGCRETVAHGVNGLLVPPRDAQALAATMERFIVDPSMIPRMAEESRRIAEEKYDVRKVNQVILQAMNLSKKSSEPI